MKTKLCMLIIMSVLCFMNTQAELKYFLPTSNAYISILDYKFWFEGDTVIENKEYIKIYRQFCYSETECDENKDYYAAVRQDTINEKIYCIQVDDGVERLIADFDVKAGDEVMIYHFEEQQERLVKILDVDEIEINGQYRKRISGFDWEYQNLDYWVEGIGSIVYGLFFSNSIPLVVDGGDGPVFLCLHVDNELIYKNPNYNVCYKKRQGPETGYWDCIEDCEKLGGTRNNCMFYCSALPEDKFKVFELCVKNCTDEGGEFGDCLTHCREKYDTNVPKNLYKEFNVSLSPTKDYLSVETEIASCSYIIYNTLGAVVKRGDLSNSSINVSMFNSGIYYVVFYHNKKLEYIHKFVK